MSSVLDLLDEEDQNDMPGWTNIPDVIKISQGAMEKALLIYELVEKRFNGARESYGGPLIDFNDPEAIIRDIVLPKKQLVRKNFIRLKPEGVQDLGQEAKRLSEQRDSRLINAGWWHTHDREVGQILPSYADDENSLLVLNDVSRNTLFYYDDIWEKFFDQEASIKSGEDLLTLLIKGSAVDPKILIKLSGETKPKQIELLRKILESAKFDVVRTFEVGFSYTLITSARELAPYGEIRIHMKNPFNDKSRQDSNLAEVQVVQVENDIVVDKSELEQMINERMEEEKFHEIKHRRIVRRPTRGAFWRFISNTTNISYFAPTSTSEIEEVVQQAEVQPEVVERVEEKSIEGSNIDLTMRKACARFVLACYDYIFQHGAEHCKYSSYLSNMISNLNNDDVATFYDLLKTTGDLAQKSEDPKLFLSRTEYNIMNLVDISDPKTLGLQLKLMEDFVNARTLEERNAILEKYLPLIIQMGEMND